LVILQHFWVENLFEFFEVWFWHDEFEFRSFVEYKGKP
jgi:hypothetical protein